MKERGEEYSSLRHYSRAHDTISNGKFVQASVHDDTAQEIPMPTADDDPGIIGNFRISYFLITIFVKVNDDDHITSSQPQTCFAAVKKCLIIEGGLLQVIDSSPVRPLQLTESVRGVGLVYACHSDPESLCFTA